MFGRSEAHTWLGYMSVWMSVNSCDSGHTFTDRRTISKEISNKRITRITYEGRFFYVRRVVDLMKTATVNANTMYIF